MTKSHHASCPRSASRTTSIVAFCPLHLIGGEALTLKCDALARLAERG